MLELLIHCLKIRNLPSYLNKEDNLIDRIDPHEFGQYVVTLEQLYEKLINLKNLGNIDYKNLASIFNAKIIQKQVHAIKSKL